MPQDDRPSSRVDSLPDIFFVSGSPKSGTTWLQRILDKHPSIVCRGEGHFISQIHFPLEKLLGNYNARLDLVRKRVYENAGGYPPLRRNDLLFLSRSIIEYLLRCKDVPPGTRWIGDKTPAYCGYLDVLLALFPNARFIHIVRDPRDVAVSRVFHAVRAGVPEADDRRSKAHKQLVWNSATAWRSHNSSFMQFDSKAKYCVRYEDLLSDFSKQTESLFRHFGECHQGALLKEIEEATNFKAMSGRDRGEEDVSSFLRKGIAGDWKSKLDAPAVEMIVGHCKDVMRAFGYQ